MPERKNTAKIRVNRYININRERFLALAHELYPDAASNTKAIAAVGAPMGFNSSHMWQIVNGVRNVSTSFVAGMYQVHKVPFDPGASDSIYRVTEKRK